jgi:hypothetical protein
MWVSVLTDNDPPTSFELPGPGGTACFSAGNYDGPRGAVWVVQAPPTSPDVYVGALGITGLQKISLHASGKWRYAWTREHAPNVVPPGTDRALLKWNRPDEQAPGLTEGIRIWVPHEELTTYQGLPQPEDEYFRDACPTIDHIAWVDDPGPGKALGFHILIGRPDFGEVLFDRYAFLGGFALAPTGEQQEACLIFLSHYEMTATDYDNINGLRTSYMRIDASSGLDPDSPSLRGFIFARGDRDVPTFWDIAGTPR